MTVARRRGSRLAAAIAVSLAVATLSAQGTPVGIFVGTPDGPQEVATYANRTGSGRLQLGAGTLDEVQKVGGLVRLICNVPLWRVRAAYLATARIFEDARAERRVLKIRTQRLTITAVMVQVMATEDPVELKRLLDAVGATPERPAYVFVTLESAGMVRDYVVAIDADP